MEKFGYIKDDSPQTEQLLNIKVTAAKDFKKYDSDYSPDNTHLKHNINEIKMAYTFVGVPINEATESIKDQMIELAKKIDSYQG